MAARRCDSPTQNPESTLAFVRPLPLNLYLIMISRILLALVGITVFIRPLSALAAAPDAALPKGPPDWKVELIAKPPQLVHPSTVCVAPDGRVFVAQDPVDMGRPSNAAEDSILCIHPDGRITKFAENLHAVFGLDYMDGKLYVHHCPIFSVFTDDNSVGKDRVDLFTTNPDPNGGGRGFNDHIPSNMRLSMDGYFYMSTGDKGIFGAVGKDGSKVNLEGGGLMRFRPDGTELEIYSTGTRNHLDVAINAEDEMFTYDNTDDGNGWWTRVTHMVDAGFYGYPYDYKPRRPYTLWMMTDYGGGSPTGAIAYNEDALPDEYRGNLFFSEWGRRQLLRLKISREGGSYKVDSRENFLTMGSEEFRPNGIAISPDGLSFYIADWNVGGWKKPDVAGRLLKVTYTGKSHAAPKPAWWVPAGSGQPFTATADELAEALKHPAQSVRLVAQRRLAERGAEASPKLIALLKDSSAPAIGRAHAIWALDAMDGGASARQEIIALLNDRDETVRAQAIRQLGTRRVRAAVQSILAALADKNAAIRFRAATALGRIGDSTATAALVSALDEDDLFALYSVFTALNRIGRADSFAWPEMVKAFNSANPRIREGVQFACRETYDEACVKALAAFTKSPTASADARAAALSVLSELHRARPAWAGRWWATQPVKSPPPPKTVEWPGTPVVLAAVRAALLDSSPLVRRAAVAGVEISRDKESAAGLRDAFASEADVEIRKAVLRTLGSLRDTAADSLISGLLAEPQKHALVLPDAIAAAGQIGDSAMVAALINLLDSAQARSAAAQSPAATDVPGTKTLLASVIEALGNTKSASAVSPMVKLLRTGDAKTRALANSGLQQIGGSPVRDALLPLLGDDDLELRRLAIATLGALRDRSVISELTKAYQNEATREVALFALAKAPDLAALDVFLDAIDVPNRELRTAANNALRPLADRALARIEERHRKQPFTRGQLAALQRLYERNTTARQGILFEGAGRPAEPAAYAAFAETHSGDASRGRSIFNNVNGSACIKCHRVGQTGGEVGPDLSGVGSKYNRVQLIESLLYPSKQILDGYHQALVITKSDDEVSGIIRQETTDTLTLVDAEGKLHAIRKSEIKLKKESQLSLMPEGVHQGLSLQEFADLSSYLESLKEDKGSAKPQKP
jgi:putative membrane-bound dehydrogenase-like protein